MIWYVHNSYDSNKYSVNYFNKWERFDIIYLDVS